MLNEPKTPDMDTELTDAQLEHAAGGKKYVLQLDPHAGYDRTTLEMCELYGKLIAGRAEITSEEKFKEVSYKLVRLGIPFSVCEMDDRYISGKL